MKLIRKTKVSRKSMEWIRQGQNRTDKERARHAGERVRRYWDCCELLRGEARWWTVAEIQKQLQVSPRLVRRTLDHLEAAALIQLDRGRTNPGRFGGNPTRARFSPTKLPSKKKPLTIA